MLTAERHAIARDTLRRAQEGIDRLSPRVKQIVLLRKVEGLNTRETAEHLGIGIDAVERQLSMGMKALADFMLGGSGRIIRQKFIRRSEEHTSELQSLMRISYAVFCLKKKKKT